MGIDFTGGNLFFVLLLFAAGLLCIIKGGDFFVDAATWIAEASRIPKFIIRRNGRELCNDYAGNDGVGVRSL